ncbi:Vms1/Ankzf1 family peptidyl-tRNA hydrolase [Amycolatopsis sp. TNS106]|uniref:Rv2629 family ribosome hibernation factor n=1 Tax=Amycolatopsis sp. TNS106 TaxID=2861750 RepID=UPI001C5641EB|nr:Vms1/Ankzf1 family peptidyl-tRNA hydrolase [Amycolatopsis sp. TNS106]
MHTSTLRQVTVREGPFASVYFDSSHDTEDAAARLDLRWRSLRKRLADEGAEERTLGALDAAVAAAPPSEGRAGRALVAEGGDVVLDEELVEPPLREVARVAPQPYLLPLLRLTPAVVPHVVVVVDKTGADLFAVGEDGAEKRTVEGADHPVHKVRGGGSAYWNIQHRVEAVAERNAAEVAREAVKLADSVGAEVLVLAGEVQARALVRDELPPRGTDKVVELEEGGRAEGSRPEALEAEVRRVLAEHAERRRRDVIDRFRAGQGRDGGTAVDGLARTTAALRSGAVETLLIDGESLADRLVWVAGDPTQVATTKEDLDVSGAAAEALTQCRADEAIPAAVLAEGAELVPVSGEGLAEGVGAVLRFAI